MERAATGIGPDEPPQELLPESAVDFYSTTSDDQYTFAPDGSKIILHADGKDIPFPRVAVAKADVVCVGRRTA